MVESSWCGALCVTAEFRTPTTIIIFKVVTKPNMVGFVFLGLKLAKMALIWVARRKVVGQKVGTTKLDSRSKKPQEAVGVSKKFNIVQAHL